MEAILKEWNIEETETLVKKLEEEMRNRKEKEDVTWKTEEEKYDITKFNNGSTNC